MARPAHIIDPAARIIVGIVPGLGMPHGATAHANGARYYFTNEQEESLDVIDTRTLELLNRIPLDGTPHRPAIGHRAMMVYVPLINRAFIQVVDLATEEVVGTIRTADGVRNIFTKPDQRHVIAGMIGAHTLTVMDTETDEALWSVEVPGLRDATGIDDGGVRPMAIEAHPGGSTRRIFVQISGHHGFKSMDWDTWTVVETLSISPPPLPGKRR